MPIATCFKTPFKTNFVQYINLHLIDKLQKKQSCHSDKKTPAQDLIKARGYKQDYGSEEDKTRYFYCKALSILHTIGS